MKNDLQNNTNKNDINNLNKNKMTETHQQKYQIGVFVGKFLPPHLGHTTQIEKCLDFCNTLFVVVADSKKRTKELCNQAQIKEILPKKRLFWLKQHFKNNKNIKFFLLDQGMLEAYPKFLNQWKQKFFNLLPQKPDVWFVDKNFLDISKKCFPELDFIGFDRTEINISATDIRFQLNFLAQNNKTLKANDEQISENLKAPNVSISNIFSQQQTKKPTNLYEAKIKNKPNKNQEDSNINKLATSKTPNIFNYIIPEARHYFLDPKNFKTIKID